MIEDHTYLFQRDAGEPFHKLCSGGPIFKIFKECSRGNTRTAEYPRSTDTFWVALNRRTR